MAAIKFRIYWMLTRDRRLHETCADQFWRVLVLLLLILGLLYVSEFVNAYTQSMTRTMTTIKTVHRQLIILCDGCVGGTLYFFSAITNTFTLSARTQ